MGMGMGMGIEQWEWEGMGIPIVFPHTSSLKSFCTFTHNMNNLPIVGANLA